MTPALPPASVPDAGSPQIDFDARPDVRVGVGGRIAVRATWGALTGTPGRGLCPAGDRDPGKPADGRRIISADFRMFNPTRAPARAATRWPATH